MRIARLLLPMLFAAQTATAQPVVSIEVHTSIEAAGVARVMIAFDVPALEGPDAPARGSPDAGAAIRGKREEIESTFGLGEFISARRFEHVNALAGEVNAAGVARLAAHPGVVRVDIDAGGSGNLAEALPLANVNSAKALGLSGVGVIVAVLDSGYDSDHLDLSDDLVDEACFCSGGGGCCPGGGTSQTGVGAAEDDHGHGTNVSGIITSAGNVAAEGGAPDADIIAVKVLDSGNLFCCTSDVVAGLDWIINNRPDVDIVNMSLGTASLFVGNCDSASASTIAFATAIDTLRSNGTSVFVSTGNNGSGTQMQAPACVANAISVGAAWDSNIGSATMLGCTDSTTAADQVTCFTNSNATTDLMAPGAPTTSSEIGGGASTFYGTSQASPLAAACAALMLDADPTLTPAQIEAALEASPASVTDATNGLAFPRVDCVDAIGALPPAVPTLLPAGLVALGGGLLLSGALALRWVAVRSTGGLRAG